MTRAAFESGPLCCELLGHRFGVGAGALASCPLLCPLPFWYSIGAVLLSNLILRSMSGALQGLSNPTDDERIIAGGIFRTGGAV